MGLLNRVKMTTPTVGTGPVTLGAAVLDALNGDFQTLDQAGAPGEGFTFNYLLQDGHKWELGTSPYNGASNPIVRNVIQSSNGNDPISLSGSATIAVVPFVSDFLSAANNVVAPGVFGFAFGNNNTVGSAGYYSGALGFGNNVTGYLAYGIGSQNTPSATGSIGIGAINATSAQNAIAIGTRNTANGYGSIIIGAGGNINISNAIVFAGPGYSGQPNQRTHYLLSGTSYDPTPVNMATDGGSPSPTTIVALPDNSAFKCRVTVNAMTLDENNHPNGDYLSMELDVILTRGVGAASTSVPVTIPPTPAILSNYRTAGNPDSWSVTLQADTTNGGLGVILTAPSANAFGTPPNVVIWQAHVITAELLGSPI